MDSTVFKFSPRFQSAIVGYMLRDYPFFLRCKRFLLFEWFSDPMVSAIVKFAFDLHSGLETARALRPMEIQEHFVKLYPDIKTQNAYFDTLKQCYSWSEQYGLDFIIQHLTAWIRLMKFRDSMGDAETIYNRGDYERARTWLRDKLQEIGETTFCASDAVDFSDPDKFLIQAQQQIENCLTLGEPLFDSALLRSAIKKNPNTQNPQKLDTLTSGCLIPGNSTVVLGASNAGKTSMMITIICANLCFGPDGKHILYITLEQGSHDITSRLAQCLTGLTGTQLVSVKNNPEHEQRFRGAMKLLDERLKYISHTKPYDMYVESVIEVIRAHQEERMARLGRGYDLLVVDYPGKLRSKQYINKRSSMWEEQLYVYDTFVNFGKHYGIHVIMPAQANREGFKISRGDSPRLLDQDDVGGAFAIMQLADNAITINSSREDMAGNRIKFHIAKCRSDGQKLSVFVSSTNLAICRTHGVSLSSTLYPPGSDLSNKILNESLLSVLPSPDGTKPTAVDPFQSSADAAQKTTDENMIQTVFGDFDPSKPPQESS